MFKPTEDTNMKTYAKNGNMEFGEQVLRGGVGMIMLETVLLTPALSPALIAGLAIVALYMVFTAIMGWEPLYALAPSTQQNDETVKASVTPSPAQSQASFIRDFKQAA
jgi:hypothetical protein